VAVRLGVLSHLILDLLTHAPDICLAPLVPEPKMGLGLYSSLPMHAFFLETGYGVLCWALFQGGKALLATILLFNLANLPLFSSAIDSKEILAGHPGIIVTVVAGKNEVEVGFCWNFSRRKTAKKTYTTK